MATDRHETHMFRQSPVLNSVGGSHSHCGSISLSHVSADCLRNIFQFAFAKHRLSSLTAIRLCSKTVYEAYCASATWVDNHVDITCAWCDSPYVLRLRSALAPFSMIACNLWQSRALQPVISPSVHLSVRSPWALALNPSLPALLQPCRILDSCSVFVTSFPVPMHRSIAVSLQDVLISPLRAITLAFSTASIHPLVWHLYQEGPGDLDETDSEHMIWSTTIDVHANRNVHVDADDTDGEIAWELDNDLEFGYSNFDPSQSLQDSQLVLQLSSHANQMTLHAGADALSSALVPARFGIPNDSDLYACLFLQWPSSMTHSTMERWLAACRDKCT